MQIIDNLMNCALCPYICRFACPVDEVIATESSSPPGKARTAILLLQNRIPWSEENVGILYQCLSCEACKEHCPFEDLDLPILLREVRKEAVNKGIIALEAIPWISSLEKYGNPLGKKAEPFETFEKAEFVYFPGCMVECQEKLIASATLEILKKAGIEAKVLGGCCGWPSLQLGDTKSFLKFAGEIKKKLKSAGCKTILTSCPSCFEAFSKLYSEMGIPLEVKVLHTSTFFLELVEKEKVKIKTISKKVTYHDPCALGRKMGIFEEPRKLLSLLGLEIIEPQKTKREATCCGGGGGFLRESSQVALKRKGELLDTNADLFATVCPTCKAMFEKADLKVKDLSEILIEALK